MDTNRLPNKHYNINQKDEGTLDDRGRDGGTRRIKEQETRQSFRNMMVMMMMMNKEEGELNCRKLAERSAYGIAFRIAVLNVQGVPK